MKQEWGTIKFFNTDLSGQYDICEISNVNIKTALWCGYVH